MYYVLSLAFAGLYFMERMMMQLLMMKEKLLDTTII